MADSTLFDPMPSVQLEKRRAFCRQYHREHREEILARKRAYDARHKERHQKAKLKYRYRMTEADADAMYAAQEGLCAICRKSISRSGNKDQAICIDHDHKTNKVRGLLCRSCNTLLGYARDNISVLRRAVAYLKKHNQLGRTDAVTLPS